MPVIFNDTSTRQELYRNCLSAGDFNSAELNERKDNIRFENANMTFQNWCFQGFRIGYSKLVQGQETRYRITNTIDSIKIYFNLKGDTLFKYKQFKQPYQVKASQYNLLYSVDLDTDVVHFSDVSEILSLQLDKDHLASLLDATNHPFSRFTSQLLGGQAQMFSKSWNTIDVAVQKCLHDIVYNEHVGDLKKLYLHSRIYELIFLLANATSNEKQEAYVIRSRERERLEFLRDYINEHYHLPLSLKLLCNLCEMNEFKLKNGFKQLFGTPVFDYVIHCRLEQARRLLLQKDKNVSDVAYEVGYSSPEYFSRAFKKRYGYRPSDV